MPEEYDFPTGGEFTSVAKLIIGYDQPELKRLDPKNPFLKLKIRDIGTGFSYPPAFGKKFEGMPLNRALENYHLLLDTEIKRIKASSI